MVYIDSPYVIRYLCFHKSKGKLKVIMCQIHVIKSVYIVEFSNLCDCHRVIVEQRDNTHNSITHQTDNAYK